MDIQAFLAKKLGPLPMAAWVFIAVVLAIALVKLTRKPGAVGATAQQAGPPGQFSTSTTRTDPKTGETVTYNASGPNSSIQSPAQLSYAASPMGYSGGDVYVNLPAETDVINNNITNQIPPAPLPIPTPVPPHPVHLPPPVFNWPVDLHPFNPPLPPPPPPSPPPSGQWYNFNNGDTLWDLAGRFYGVKSYDAWHKIWDDPRNSWLVKATGGTTDWHDTGHYHIPGGSRLWVPA